MRLLVDLFFVPADDALSQAVASHLGLLLDVRWDKASVRGRWRRFGGDLVELATDAAREDTMLQATSALGHRLEVGKYRLLLTLAAPAEVAVVARGLRSFVRACPVELDRGSVRAVGEAELDSCPGRFEADAIVDVATERSFDLHVDPPCAWEAIASDPLPPGVVRDVADGVGVLCWTSTFEPEACYRAFSVRSTWLRRTLGGRDAPTGAVPEAPCRPEWHPLVRRSKRGFDCRRSRLRTRPASCERSSRAKRVDRGRAPSRTPPRPLPCEQVARALASTCCICRQQR